MSPSVDPTVAGINPSAFALGNQQQQANLASTQQEQAFRAQDIAVRQQQAQQEQVKTQLLQRTLQDQEIERQMFRDYYGAQAGVNAPSGATTTPTPGGPSAPAPVGNPLGDPQTYARYMAAHGASGPAIMAGMSSIVTLGTNIAKMNSDQIDLETKNLNKLRDDAVGYVAQPSEQAYSDLYKDVIQREPKIADELPPPGPGVAPGQQDIQHFLGKVGALGQLLANRKTQADIEEQAAKAKEEGTKAAHQELVNKLMQQGEQASQNGQNPIDTVFPTGLDQPTHDSYAAAWQAAGRQPPDENGRRPAQDSILSAAASHAAEYRKAVSPTIRAGEVAKTVATEQATAQIKTQVAVNTQRALNSTAAVGNVPPHLIPQYQGEVAKVASAYGDAANAANEMQEMIDLMRGHNKIAYAYSPTTGVLTINSANGTKRVNTAEIAQYAGAGSLLDRVTGYFGKQLSGESVPSDIVDAMEQVHSTLGEGARNSAVAKIKSLNAQYGATTDPEAILVKPTKATAPPRAGAPAQQHVIQIGNKRYRYKGSGATDDLKNYTEITQ